MDLTLKVGDGNCKCSPPSQWKRTAFISGHLDLSDEEFSLHYRPLIEKAVQAGDMFVVGDARGADLMAQKLLMDLMGPQESNARVCVYHLHATPLNYVPGLRIHQSNFKSHNAKDSAMTFNSDYDILWVRPPEESRKLFGIKFDPKRVSGTERNRRRREKLKRQIKPTNTENSVLRTD